MCSKSKYLEIFSFTTSPYKYTKNILIHILYFPLPWVLGKLFIKSKHPWKRALMDLPTQSSFFHILWSRAAWRTQHIFFHTVFTRLNLPPVSYCGYCVTSYHTALPPQLKRPPNCESKQTLSILSCYCQVLCHSTEEK